jgi:hypothetical protein
MLAVDSAEGSAPSGGAADAPEGDHSKYDNGSQLPNVEEYKAQNGAIVRNETRWGGLKWCLIALIAIILAAICAGISLFIIEKKDSQPAYNSRSSNLVSADGDSDSVDNPADLVESAPGDDPTEYMNLTDLPDFSHLSLRMLLF